MRNRKQAEAEAKEDFLLRYASVPGRPSLKAEQLKLELVDGDLTNVKITVKLKSSERRKKVSEPPA